LSLCNLVAGIHVEFYHVSQDSGGHLRCFSGNHATGYADVPGASAGFGFESSFRSFFMLFRPCVSTWNFGVESSLAPNEDKYQSSQQTGRDQNLSSRHCSLILPVRSRPSVGSALSETHQLSVSTNSSYSISNRSLCFASSWARLRKVALRFSSSVAAERSMYILKAFFSFFMATTSAC
jgi:hypothetical protein